MAYTTAQKRNDLYHFAGYSSEDLNEATRDEIENLWDYHFNKKIGGNNNGTNERRTRVQHMHHTGNREIREVPNERTPQQAADPIPV